MPFEVGQSDYGTLASQPTGMSPAELLRQYGMLMPRLQGMFTPPPASPPPMGGFGSILGLKGPTQNYNPQTGQFDVHSPNWGEQLMNVLKGPALSMIKNMGRGAVIAQNSTPHEFAQILDSSRAREANQGLAEEQLRQREQQSANVLASPIAEDFTKMGPSALMALQKAFTTGQFGVAKEQAKQQGYTTRAGEKNKTALDIQKMKQPSLEQQKLKDDLTRSQIERNKRAPQEGGYKKTQVDMIDAEIDKNLASLAQSVNSDVRATINGRIQELRAARAKLTGEAPQNKKLDENGAREFLKQAGGNKDKARELARQQGYDF